MKNLKFYKVMRAPLEMPTGPKVHWGFAIQDIFTNKVLVLHNTPAHNVHLDTLEAFHAGQEWDYQAIPYSETIYQRFLNAAKDQRQYDLLTNNCQQTYTGIVDGFSWTPVVWFVGVLVLGGVLIYAANRSGGSST